MLIKDILIQLLLSQSTVCLYLHLLFTYLTSSKRGFTLALSVNSLELHLLPRTFTLWNEHAKYSYTEPKPRPLGALSNRMSVL